MRDRLRLVADYTPCNQRLPTPSCSAEQPATLPSSTLKELQSNSQSYSSTGIGQELNHSKVNSQATQPAEYPRLRARYNGRPRTPILMRSMGSGTDLMRFHHRGTMHRASTWAATLSEWAEM